MQNRLKKSLYRENMPTIMKFVNNLIYKTPKIPKALYIEPTNYCNLKCVMCYHRHESPRTEGFMDFDMFKIIINDASEFGIKSVALQMAGEPLLHPRLIDMIKYAKEKKLNIGFSTNVTLLDEKMINEILGSGLDRIIFAVDGNCSETYQSIRVGGNYDRVCENIIQFIKSRNETDYYEYNSPTVTLQTIVMKKTENEVPKLIEKWSRIVDNIILTSVYEYDGLTELHPFDIDNLSKRIPCDHLFKRPEIVVLWNGDITVCCQDLLGKLVIEIFQILGVLRVHGIQRNSICYESSTGTVNFVRHVHTVRI